MAKRNGVTIKNISIIIGTIVALLSVGSIIWGFATQSGNLDRVVKDVVKTEEDITAVDVRMNVVEDAVMLIQYDIENIKGDSAEILERVKELGK